MTVVRVAWLGTGEAADEVDTPALLREAVVGGVDDPPLDLVAEVAERREHDREVTPPLRLAGDLSSRSTFSRNRYGGRFSVSSRWICHQRTPFLPSMPAGLVERLRHRVVLAGEATDEQLVVGDGPLARLDLVHDRSMSAHTCSPVGKWLT